MATATRLDGYEAREARAPTWFDEEAPEGPALAWLASHGAALAPNGSGLHVKLAGPPQGTATRMALGAADAARMLRV